MITVSLEGIEGITRKLAALSQDLQGPAMYAAINKTAAKAQTEINRAIRDEYAVRADEVRNAITMRRRIEKRQSARRAYFSGWRAASLAVAHHHITIIRSSPGDPAQRAAATAQGIAGTAT